MSEKASRNHSQHQNPYPDRRRDSERSWKEQKNAVRDSRFPALGESRSETKSTVVSWRDRQLGFLHSKGERRCYAQNVEEEHRHPLHLKLGRGDRKSEDHRTVRRHVENNIEVGAEFAFLSGLSGIEAIGSVRQTRQPPEQQGGPPELKRNRRARE